MSKWDCTDLHADLGLCCWHKGLFPMHTCHISHWDIISQNLAHLEGSSHEKFKSRRIFRSFHNRFYEKNKHKSHTVVVFHKLFTCQGVLGESKVMSKKFSQNFVKSPLRFSLTSQILIHILWHVCPRCTSYNLSLHCLLWPVCPNTWVSKVHSFPSVLFSVW